MTKAKIIYDLNDSDDSRSFAVAMKADETLCALWEFDNWLRSQYKHGPSGKMAQYVEVGCDRCSIDYEAIVEDIRITFNEILNEAGVKNG